MKLLSDEEIKIAKCISELVRSYHITGTVIDIWWWDGTISRMAFGYHPDIKVQVIDILPFSLENLPWNITHRIADIFSLNAENITPVQETTTLLFSHVLQYIDTDQQKLLNKVHQLHPDNVILVINQNNDIMKDALQFFAQKKRDENAEQAIKWFPGQDYQQVDYKEFNGIFYKSENMTTAMILATLLFDSSLTIEQLEQLDQFLDSKWCSNQFSVNQQVILYQRKP